MTYFSTNSFIEGRTLNDFDRFFSSGGYFSPSAAWAHHGFLNRPAHLRINSEDERRVLRSTDLTVGIWGRGESFEPRGVRIRYDSHGHAFVREFADAVAAREWARTAGLFNVALEVF